MIIVYAHTHIYTHRFIKFRNSKCRWHGVEQFVLGRWGLVSDGQEQISSREMNSQNRRFFGPEGGEEKRLGIGLDGRVVRHVNLFQACVTHELVEVPEGDAAVVGRRGQNVVVAAEEQHGDHAGVVTEVAELE